MFSTSFVEFCSFKWVATIFCAVIYYLLYFWYSVALVVPLNNSIYHPTVYILLSFFTIVVFGQPYPYMDKPVNNVIWVLLLIFVLHFRMLFTMGCFLWRQPVPCTLYIKCTLDRVLCHTWFLSTTADFPTWSVGFWTESYLLFWRTSCYYRRAECCQYTDVQCLYYLVHFLLSIRTI